MRGSILLCLVGFFSIASAAVIQIEVLDDTYIRSDSGGPDSKNDGDSDNEIIVGRNGAAGVALLNGLARFDLSDILALGPAANLQINSVTLTGITRAGDTGQGSNVTLTLYEYGFEFIEAHATWNDPDGDGAIGTGDITPGGTLGTLLSSVLVADPIPSGQSIIYADSPAFRSAVAGQLAGDGTLNLLLTGTGDNTQSFVRFDDEDRANPLLLAVDVTVIPEMGSVTLFGLSALLLAAKRSRA